MVITWHSGRWTLEDRFGSSWQYLPVEVPAGACGLRAELEYDWSGAVLDLGCIGPGGFRGSSGGARRSFVITPEAGTPRYPPGDLEPRTRRVQVRLPPRPPRRRRARARTRRMASLPRARCLLRGGRGAWGRGPLGSSPQLGSGARALTRAPPAASGRVLALALARPALDDAAGLVAGLGP